MKFFAVLLLSAAALFAQDAVNLPWWTSPVVQDLGLSADQTQHINQIVRNYRGRLLDARNEVAKAEADFDDVYSDPQVSAAKAKPVIERLALARANVTRIFTSMSVEIRSVLTAEQWRALVKRWDEVKQTKGNAVRRLQP